MADDPGPLPPTFVQNVAARPAGRLGGDFVRRVLARIDSLRGDSEFVSRPRRQGPAFQPGLVVRRVLWLVANSTLLLLLGLAVLAAGPVYAIFSDGAARRWQDEHAIRAFVLRFLNPPLAVALVVGIFGILVGVVGGLLGFDGPRIRRFRARVTRLVNIALVVGILEPFTWVAQQVFPWELVRALLGMLFILAGARSLFRFPPRTKRDVLFIVGLALAVEGVASLLWDSGWIWHGRGEAFAIVAALAAVVMVVLRRRYHWKGGFGSSARVLGKAVEEARLFALAIRASRPRARSRDASRAQHAIGQMSAPKAASGADGKGHDDL